MRQYNQHFSAAAAQQPRVDPLQAAQTPVDEMMRHAYVFVLLFSIDCSLTVVLMEEETLVLILQIC